jgi:hypothetical protein
MCTPDHITHVRVLLNPHLQRGHTRIVLTWGDRWWNREANIAQLELVVQTPAGCLIRLGNPEVEIEPEIGPEFDKVCVEELKSRGKSLASDVRHGGPITIELENLSHGRYWVTVLERSSEAGGMDVTKMEFPECGKIFEATDAEVSVFTSDGGQQRFVVNKDGDLYGKGRCTWDVVGLDGATNELHRIYPEGHDQKPSLQNDPYAKFAVDAHGNKIIQVPPAPTVLGAGAFVSTWPMAADNILMNSQPGPYVDGPENNIQGDVRDGSTSPGYPVSPSSKQNAVSASSSKQNDGSVQIAQPQAGGETRMITNNGWKDKGVGGGLGRQGVLHWPEGGQGARRGDIQKDVMDGWNERGGAGGGSREEMRGTRQDSRMRSRDTERSRYTDEEWQGRRDHGSEIQERPGENHRNSGENYRTAERKRGREVREYEWPDQSGQPRPRLNDPQVEPSTTKYKFTHCIHM